MWILPNHIFPCWWKLIIHLLLLSPKIVYAMWNTLYLYIYLYLCIHIYWPNIYIPFTSFPFWSSWWIETSLDVRTQYFLDICKLTLPIFGKPLWCEMWLYINDVHSVLSYGRRKIQFVLFYLVPHQYLKVCKESRLLLALYPETRYDNICFTMHAYII